MLRRAFIPAVLLLSALLSWSSPVAADATGDGPSAVPPSGYWLVSADGGVFTFGNAAFYGSLGGVRLNRPIVGMAGTPSGRGYWLVSADGGVFTFGDAAFYGSLGGVRLNRPIVGMAATNDGRGYWLVSADGGVFTFGDAPFLGAAFRAMNTNAVGIAADRLGSGYRVVDTTGFVKYFGSPDYGSSTLDAPTVGISAAPSGGHWTVGRDGEVATSGAPQPLATGPEVGFYGQLSSPSAGVVGIAATPAGDGYYLFLANGDVAGFGNAPLSGSMRGKRLNRPIVGGETPG